MYKLLLFRSKIVFCKRLPPSFAIPEDSDKPLLNKYEPLPTPLFGKVIVLPPKIVKSFPDKIRESVSGFIVTEFPPEMVKSLPDKLKV